jgi:hypothetical protein
MTILYTLNEKTELQTFGIKKKLLKWSRQTMALF